MTRTAYQPGPATDHYHDTFGADEATVVNGVDGVNGADGADGTNGTTPSASDIVAALKASLPTSDPAVAGELWNSSGTLMVSAG